MVVKLLAAIDFVRIFVNLMIDDALMDNHSLPMPMTFSYFLKPMTYSL